MKRIYFLSTCDTCKRIKDSLPLEGVELWDIKTRHMSATEVDQMIALTGSAEALFSKRARKYKELGLKDKNLSDTELRNFIIEEYTFLKRPVLVLEDQIFVGNSKKVVEQAREALMTL